MRIIAPRLSSQIEVGNDAQIIAYRCKITQNLSNTSHWRNLVKRWRAPVREFVVREWTKAPIGAAIGLIGTIMKELLADDDAFRTTLSNKWHTVATHPGFRGLDSYLPILGILAGILILASMLRLLPLIVKVAKSWIFGVVGGLIVWWAISFFFFFSQNSLFLFRQLEYALVTALTLTVVSIALRVRAVQASSQIPTSVSFAVPARATKPTQEDNLSKLDPDSPIEEWDQDVLERSALVESLATTVIVSKAPVVAIQGPFGDGKSSVLNLLKRTLEPHAIVCPDPVLCTSVYESRLWC